MNDRNETRPHLGMPAETPDDVPTTAAEAAVEFDDLPPGTRQVVPAPSVHSPAQVIEQAGNGQAMQVVDPNPLAMLASALQQGHDVEKLGALMDLAERYEANQARKEYAAAMSKFQGTCPAIVQKDTATVTMSSGGAYSYSYADLDTIMATIRPTLKKCGLSVTYDTKIAEDGASITSYCHVMHKDGHVEVRTFQCPVDNLAKMNDSQKMGSANAYASRYNVCNALGLTSGEDDDGAAGERSRGAPPAPKATDLDEFFPIGKHKGERWDAVPLDYLEWAVANLTEKPDIVARCKEQIGRRGEMHDPTPAPEGELTMAECARGITQAQDAKALAEVWGLVPDKHRDGLAAFHETRATELAG